MLPISCMLVYVPPFFLTLTTLSGRTQICTTIIIIVIT